MNLDLVPLSLFKSEEKAIAYPAEVLLWLVKSGEKVKSFVNAKKHDHSPTHMSVNMKLLESLLSNSYKQEKYQTVAGIIAFSIWEVTDSCSGGVCLLQFFVVLIWMYFFTRVLCQMKQRPPTDACNP